MTRSEKTHPSQWLSAILWTVVITAAAVLLLVFSPTAREVVGEASLTVFQIVTAPFVLEASLALLGLCIVLMINQYRHHKEGDGWVYLEKQEPSSDAVPGTEDPPHRHDAVVWHDKPERFDEAAAKLDVIEGYVDLGLAGDALRELELLPEELAGAEQVDEMRIRALAMAGRLPEAVRLLDERAGMHPGRSSRLARAAVAVAAWLQEQGEAGPAIDDWLERSRRLDPQVIGALPPGHALKARTDN